MSVSGSCHRMMGHSEWSVPVSVTSDDVGQVKYETEISEINFSQKIPPSLSSDLMAPTGVTRRFASGVMNDKQDRKLSEQIKKCLDSSQVLLEFLF